MTNFCVKLISFQCKVVEWFTYTLQRPCSPNCTVCFSSVARWYRTCLCNCQVDHLINCLHQSQLVDIILSIRDSGVRCYISTQWKVDFPVGQLLSRALKFCLLVNIFDLAHFRVWFSELGDLELEHPIRRSNICGHTLTWVRWVL